MFFLLKNLQKRYKQKHFIALPKKCTTHQKVANIFSDTTIKNCWPVWDKHHLPDAQRERITRVSLAKDSMHYGIEHHKRFAELFLGKFGGKLR